MGNTPIVQTLIELSRQEKISLHMPGHKQGQRPGFLAGWLGEALQYDQTEIGSLDSLHSPAGPIRQAESLVAELYGTKATYFTTNGSTAGLIASLLASASPGAEVIVPRNAHKAVLAGIILADLLPRFVTPAYHGGYELGITAASLQAALEQYPQAQAVVLLSPTYEGVTGDLAQLVSLAKAAHCNVIVDEAHGAHFLFHPCMPPSAVCTQADWVVQSAHKTLTALTGAAWVHRLNDNFADDWLRSRLNLVQTTSPSWLILGSLDIAQYELRRNGRTWLERAVEQASQLRQAILQHTPFSIWTVPSTGSYKQDPLKIVVQTTGSGYTGYELARYLEDHGIFVEMAKAQGILLMLTLADTKLPTELLVRCLNSLPRRHPQTRDSLPPPPPAPPLVLSPRSAYLAPTSCVDAAAAAGRIAARAVYAYPPGSPLIYPGELIERELLVYVDESCARGGYLTGLQEDTWVVVAEN